MGFIFMASTLPFPMLSAVIRISEIAKIPIRVGRVSNPAISELLPKVNLGVPSMGAMPTRANISPSIPASTPFTMEPEASTATIVSAKNEMPKFSAGVNFRAMSASSGAQKVSTRKENTEPRKENTMPYPRALPASPFFAMGCPSKQVAMDDAVPGMLSRMAEIRPPEIPPMYTATSRFMPMEGVMLKVRGRNNATAMAAESPGMEPNIIPTATPAAMSSKDVGRQMLTKAPPKDANAFMVYLL